MLADAVDVPALAAAWREKAQGAGMADLAVAEEAPRVGDRGPEARTDQPEVVVPEAGQSSLETPMPVAADPAAMEEDARRGGPPGAAVCVETDGRSTAEGVVTRLDQGPGWTLEVSHPRAGGAAGAGGPLGSGA